MRATGLSAGCTLRLAGCVAALVVCLWDVASCCAPATATSASKARVITAVVIRIELVSCRFIKTSSFRSARFTNLLSIDQNLDQKKGRVAALSPLRCDADSLEGCDGGASVGLVRLSTVALAAELSGLVRAGGPAGRVVGSTDEEHGRIGT